MPTDNLYMNLERSPYTAIGLVYFKIEDPSSILVEKLVITRSWLKSILDTSS